MKSVKLTKKMLKMSPSELLLELGAVNNDKNHAYPQHVYLSKEDYKKLSVNVRKMYKKEYPYLSEKKLNYTVGMELLNLGPNEILGAAVRPGYALVDEEYIKVEIQNMECTG